MHRTATFLPLVGIYFLLSACCPSGAWQDNFGVTYQLTTIPPASGSDVSTVTGVADTLDLGCGVWTVEGTSLATGTDRAVELHIINPRPNPSDPCCYSYQFNGQVAGSGCNFISGQYQSSDGKCTQSGEMSLINIR